MNEHEISAFAQNFSESIVRGVFAQADTRSVQQVLLDDLQASHDRSQLYDVSRIRELVETLGFRIYCSGSEFPLSIRSRLNLSADAPAAASVELGAILIQDWPLTKLARDLRLHPRAVLAASILHEAGHLLAASEGISDQLQRERRAWQLGRNLLERHGFYGLCSEGSFNTVEAMCRQSYGDPNLTYRQSISGQTIVSLL